MEFSQLLKTICPWIGTAIAGPLGGIAVDMATSALGLSDKTADGLKNALAGASAADMLALQKAEQEFQTTMQSLGYKSISDLETIAAGDRASARDMQKTLRSWVPATLSILVTVGFFGLLIGMTFGDFKIADSQALLMMLGSLTTAWGSVMAYYFGSTAGSAEKTAIIAKSTPVK